MKITAEEVQHVAKLARLAIHEEDLALFAQQLDAILSYVDILNRLDTDSVEPTFQVFAHSNAMREDVIEPSLTQQEALANAPEQKDGGYLVPRVMEGGGA